MCVHVYVDAHVCAAVCAVSCVCVWRPEINLGVILQVLCITAPLFLRLCEYAPLCVCPLPLCVCMPMHVVCVHACMHVCFKMEIFTSQELAK